MANFLLDDELAPITSEIGFVETDPITAADTFIKWQTPLQLPKVSLIKRSIKGTLESVLRHLLPLTSVEARRFLFVPTTGVWTAYFDNNLRGTDCSSLSYFVTLLKCRGLRVAAVPNTKTKRSERGRYGALIFELYGPEDTAAYSNYIRTIALVNDGGKWVFHQSGPVLPFEQPDLYRAAKTIQRFSLDHLSDYLKALGVFAFEETFYAPQDRPAILIEKNGPVPKALKEYSLEEARRQFSGQ